MIEFFYRKPKDKYLDKVPEWMECTSLEASKVPPLVEGDCGVTIHCGGREEHWGSRWLAYHYYLTAGLACDGSEGDRYHKIADDLVLGIEIPSDGMPIRKAA